MTEPLTYRGAGVDVEAKSRLLEALRPAIEATHGGAVAAGMGAFAGALQLPDGACLAATTDGVGTKTLLARRFNRDEVIGADIVAHCANDLAAQGARPVAFLDYIAMGRLDAGVVETVIRAMARACADLGVALLGGETAEMPDVYAAGAYDVVGTMIGLAPAGRLLTGRDVAPGARVIGLAAAGLHTNGYSLARRVLDALPGVVAERPDADLGGTPADVLLAPHRCYAPVVLGLVPRVRLLGIAHITGGGLIDNIVRVLPDGCRATLRRTWPEPPIFDWLRRHGSIPETDMIATFNLGIGMALILPAPDVPVALRHCADAGIPAWEIGQVTTGVRGVEMA
jgi:phosphoribosylformylglycinamidine cyclo-ligase